MLQKRTARERSDTQVLHDNMAAAIAHYARQVHEAKKDLKKEKEFTNAFIQLTELDVALMQSQWSR